MPKTLALIHTSMVFVSVETMMQDIFAEVMPDVRLINIVDDSLLPDVMMVGEVTPAVTRRMCAYVTAAQVAGADVILSLCSSLGPAIDAARNLVEIPVLKIDEAMAMEAARSADRIGVLATVPTTIGPTVALIHEKAAEIGKEVQVSPALAEGAFQALMSRDKTQHDAIVSATARELAANVDLLVLAQASMTRLTQQLREETRIPVLNSPRSGIEYARTVLDSLANHP